MIGFIIFYYLVHLLHGVFNYELKEKTKMGDYKNYMHAGYLEFSDQGCIVP